MDTYKLMRKAYEYSIGRLRDKVKKNEKIRVCFAVIFNNVFPMAPVFENMLNDDIFEPFLAIIPDRSRGFKHEITEFIKTTDFLKKRYPGATIAQTYNRKTKEYMDISSQCDLYCTANPYELMTASIYTIHYFWIKHIPVFYSNYCLDISPLTQNNLKKTPYIKKLWRLYVANQYDMEAFSANPYCPPAILSGYPRLDALAKANITADRRKKIVIAPHHSIMDLAGGVHYGTFLEYAELFLQLPVSYPDVDFVVRPHPLLFTALEREDVWGEARAQAYWNRLEALPNVELQKSGEYFDAFMNSDGLIHDCTTFTVSYLFTGKPCCRLVSPRAPLETDYNELGKKCLEGHYLAFNEKDIINFIEETVLKNQDPKKEIREKIRDELAINYPHASEFIIDDLKKAILT